MDNTACGKFCIGSSLLFHDCLFSLLQDSVTYQIIQDTTNSIVSDSLDYFFVNQFTGEVYLSQPLTEAPLDQYSVSSI